MASQDTQPYRENRKCDPELAKSAIRIVAFRAEYSALASFFLHREIRHLFVVELPPEIGGRETKRKLLPWQRFKSAIRRWRDLESFDRFKTDTASYR